MRPPASARRPGTEGDISRARDDDSAGTIRAFRGEHGFLSNFHRSPIRVEGTEYPTVEHAFQAAKAANAAEGAWVGAAPTPGEAKRRGRRVRRRPDWDRVRVEVMTDLVRRKFRDPGLARRLLATAERPLVEENTWDDTFWGVCDGRGENHLGRILMRIRDELRAGGPVGSPADARGPGAAST